MWVAWLAARAPELPNTKACAAIRIKKPAQVSSSGVPRNSTPTVSMITAVLDIVSPKPIRVRGRNRPTSRALTSDSSTWLSAVEAKNSANGIGCMPFITCSTYEEFAT